jgi:ADP-ribose pyrophosphatase
MEVGDERVSLPNGTEIDGFLWIRTRDFAATVAITDASEVVLIRSYKHGPRTVGLAVPAGYIEAGEEPLATAMRELREETGYEAGDWTPLGRYVVDGNYGVCTEHVFLARDARLVAEPRPGDLEEIAVALMPLDEVAASLRRGDVVQLSSAAALGLALLQPEVRTSPDGS